MEHYSVAFCLKRELFIVNSTLDHHFLFFQETGLCPLPLLTSRADERVRGEQLERVHLEEHGVEEQLSGRRTLRGVLAQAPPDQVALLVVLQLVDGALDHLGRDHRRRRRGRRGKSGRRGRRGGREGRIHRHWNKGGREQKHGQLVGKS